MSKRRDRCKCGKIIVWDPVDSVLEIKCEHCGRIYAVESDEIMIYWLVEKLSPNNPWKTNSR